MCEFFLNDKHKDVEMIYEETLSLEKEKSYIRNVIPLP